MVYNSYINSNLYYYYHYMYHLAVVQSDHPKDGTEEYNNDIESYVASWQLMYEGRLPHIWSCIHHLFSKED